MLDSLSQSMLYSYQYRGIALFDSTFSKPFIGKWVGLGLAPDRLATGRVPCPGESCPAPRPPLSL
jgi:hypothetical protein